LVSGGTPETQNTKNHSFGQVLYVIVFMDKCTKGDFMVIIFNKKSPPTPLCQRGELNIFTREFFITEIEFLTGNRDHSQKLCWKIKISKLF